ncbi:MAG: DMT family protein [Planctomycetes bacterium]|nr:DMT family protein [Planctomycetota bacterium]
MPPVLAAVLLLCCSNLFMTYAWYGHLRDLADRPIMLVALVAWGVAFFEYQLQVPANRIGATVLSVPQLRILQEVVSLAVFVPFAVFYMKAQLTLDFLWAGLCLLGAVYFMFRGGMPVHG